MKLWHFYIFSTLTEAGLFLMESKVCSRCLIEKAPVEFNRDRAAKDGLSFVCKSCNKANCRIHYRKDIEKHRLLARLYYRNHLDERKRYRGVNKEKNKKYQANYRAQRKRYLNLLERQRRERLQVKQDLWKKAEPEGAQLRLLDE